MSDQYHFPEGFRAAGVACGLKRDNQLDIALITSDLPCAAAGIFTTNRVKAAPVLYNQKILAHADTAVYAVLANTGSANACTGADGLARTKHTVKRVAQAIDCAPDEVLALSTGVIGLPLELEPVERGVLDLHAQLSRDGWPAAAEAIMTTDTRPKLATFRHSDGYTIAGIAKGAGMIAPNMATMLAVIATDAAIDRALLRRALHRAADASFNRIIVDGDMSTNDSVIALANGASGVQVTDEDALVEALQAVCIPLAQAIVRDGEGATKFVTVHVTGASDENSARQVARTIGTSALVKTAFYGADPNWGRIVCAAGYSGIEVKPERMALWLLDAEQAPAIQLVEQGEPIGYDEQAAIALMQGPAWGVRLDLGMGERHSWIWTCDLSHEYVSINGHYRT